MKLKIISATKKVFEGEVQYVNVPGGNGHMQILPHHADLLSTLEVGEIKILTHDNNEMSILINGGLIQVQNDSVSVLADEAVDVEELILEEIEEAEGQAKEKIYSDHVSSTELIQLSKTLQYEKLKKQSFSKYRK